MAVDDAESAPPAASWIGVPPAAPEPTNAPTTATTALTAIAMRFQIFLMSTPFVSMLMKSTVRRRPAARAAGVQERGGRQRSVARVRTVAS